MPTITSLQMIGIYAIFIHLLFLCFGYVLVLPKTFSLFYCFLFSPSTRDGIAAVVFGARDFCRDGWREWASFNEPKPTANECKLQSIFFRANYICLFLLLLSTFDFLWPQEKKYGLKYVKLMEIYM